MFDTTRRKAIGATLLGAGAVLHGLGIARAETLVTKGRIMLDGYPTLPRGLVEAATFPLIEAIHGRRSRRFAKGATIPGGPLAYASKEAPQAIDPLEQALLLATIAGNTGWANLIPWNPAYAPKIPNYAGAAGGRSFPSAAGFATTEFFYTDDDGAYFLPTRDMAPVTGDGGPVDLRAWLDAHKARVVKLADGRLNIPAEVPHMEGHNTWCANVPGSTLVIPVSDLAQHMVLLLLYLVQNGVGIYDNVNNRPIPGLEAYAHRIDLAGSYPLTFLEQSAITDVTVELGTSCYAGALTLQALGLGGWMYTGINPFTVLGATGDPAVPGLGFRFEMLDGDPLPHVLGLPGVFEPPVPPFVPNMRAAVEAVVARKFGAGGPFSAGTGGPYKENAAVRASGAEIDAEAIDITVLMADYILATFGRFPATIPPVFVKTFLQAHRLDTGFYDTHFAAGGYLRTHAAHDANWS